MNKHGPSFGEVTVLTGLTLVIAGSLLALPERLPRLALVNESPSLPRGLYVRDLDGRPSRGAIVAVHQPMEAQEYLGRFNVPGDMLLIKRVAADGGETACEKNGFLRLPEHTVRVPQRDRLGGSLPRWGGCRALDPDELFLVGDTPTSFDSRYFGPVRTAQVQGVYKEVLTW